jgi:hypothetical protein
LAGTIHVLRGSAVVSTAVFGVSPKTLRSLFNAVIGHDKCRVKLAGGTLARATETVALPGAPRYATGHILLYLTHF